MACLGTGRRSGASFLLSFFFFWVEHPQEWLVDAYNPHVVHQVPNGAKPSAFQGCGQETVSIWQFGSYRPNGLRPLCFFANPASFLCFERQPSFSGLFGEIQAECIGTEREPGESRFQFCAHQLSLRPKVTMGGSQNGPLLVGTSDQPHFWDSFQK